MIKMNLFLSIVLGITITNGIFANNPNEDIEGFDISTIEYIEDEIEIDLGFDVRDYLPENFDPYKIYVDLNAIEYIEDEIEIANLTQYLPEDFDAYAYPTDVQSINYIDPNDSFTIDFDTKKHLPEDFNPYIK